MVNSQLKPKNFAKNPKQSVVTYGLATYRIIMDIYTSSVLATQFYHIP